MIPTFSIIIPAFNEEPLLPGCLESIKSVDYPEDRVEVIVVDNGSTDRTREIAESFGVKVLRDDTLTVSGLRNMGAVRADGEILAFVDADCLVTENWLMNAAVYFDKADIAAWGSPPEPPEKPTWVQETWYLVRKKDKAIQDVDWLESMNLFVRKEQFLEIGGFNEELVTCEDVDFSYRIQKYGKIVSNTQIRTVHMGEAATLKIFYKKELWRGKGNLQGIRSHGFSLKELPSLVIPIYFGILFPAALILFFLLLGTSGLAAAGLFYLMPGIAALYKIRKKRIGIPASFKLLMLLHVYFYARTVAVIKK